MTNKRSRRPGRSRRKARRRRARSTNSWLLWGLIGASIILVVAGVAMLSRSRIEARSAAPPPALPPDTAIVRGEALFGEHEMEPLSIPIPYLPQDGPQPILELPVTSYDFGSVGSKDVVRQTFAVWNRGMADLTVVRVYTTCGCTTAELSARVIPPGKAALLTAIFDAGFHEVQGEVQRGVIIESNDPAQPEAIIKLTASVQ